MRLSQLVKADKLPGGLGDDADISDFDPKEVEMGLKVEREHTDDEEIVQEIVTDHLTEIPDYYTRLKKMEDAAKKEGNARRAEIRAENTPKQVEAVLLKRLDESSELYDKLKATNSLHVGDFFKKDLPQLSKIGEQVIKKKKDLEVALYRYHQQLIKDLKSLKKGG